MSYCVIVVQPGGADDGTLGGQTDNPYSYGQYEFSDTSLIGTLVSIHATGFPGYEFDHWTLTGTSPGTYNANPIKLQIKPGAMYIMKVYFKKVAPPPPTYHTFNFHVVDANTGLPIAGATVSMAAKVNNIMIPWAANTDHLGNAAITITTDEVGVMWGVAASGYQTYAGTGAPSDSQINTADMVLATVPPTYADVMVTVSPSAEGGTISPVVGNYTDTYQVGGSFTLEVTPSDGWVISTITRNGTVISNAPGHTVILIVNLQEVEQIVVTFTQGTTPPPPPSAPAWEQIAAGVVIAGGLAGAYLYSKRKKR